MNEPEFAQGQDQVREIGQGIGLHQVAIGAGVVGPGDVIGPAGGGEDDHRQATELRLLPKPLQHFEPGPVGQVQVQQHQTRQRMCLAIGKRPVARQVILRRLPVLHGLQRILDARLGQYMLEQDHVALFIFHVKNNDWAHRVIP